MLNIFKKIINDTLMTPDSEKYSRKSLTMFFAFLNMTLLSWVESLSSMPILSSCCKITVPEYIVVIFAGMALGQGALTVWDKKK